MDINLITKIAAAGAMGVSIFCIIQVYNLMKKEQQRDQIRKNFIKIVNRFMVFAVVMTVLSLVIEVVRHQLGTETVVDGLVEERLQEISRQDYFSMTSSGTPIKIEFDYNDSTYTLSEPYPREAFKNVPLTLVKDEQAPEQFLAAQQQGGRTFIMGNIKTQQLRSAINDNKDKTTQVSELYTLGFYNTPASVRRQAIIKAPQTDRDQANQYLTQLVAFRDNPQKSLSQRAIKILVQPDLLKSFTREQYDIVIDGLKTPGIGEAPWNSYELAQVYLTRSLQIWNKANQKVDREQYFNYLREYHDLYQRKTWIQNQNQYPREYAWFLEAKKELGI